MPDRDTIFAPATAQGRAGVSVIRISGPVAECALSTLLGDQPLPVPRRAALRRLLDNVSRETIDEALVLLFEQNASFTGEPVVELQCHGSRAVVAALLRCLGDIPGLRLAEPGEFARRAFHAGRLDLAQVEGLADLIAADTEIQRKTALRMYDGQIGRQCQDWSQALTRGLALLEATIDFADEDISEETWQIAASAVFHVKHSIAAALSEAQTAERFQCGWRVAIIGAPNAGKSSLINALARRDVALTSAQPGTTRDSIEVALDLGGFPVTVIDTAGIRDASDEIERAGVLRAKSIAESADLRIALMAADAPLDSAAEALLQPGDLRVWNKSDVARADGDMLAISTRTGTGIDALIEALAGRLSLSEPSEGILLLRERHRQAMLECAKALQRFAELSGCEGAALQNAPEIAAEEVRSARAALGRITGDVGVEALLDVIFSEFCLGK